MKRCIRLFVAIPIAWTAVSYHERLSAQELKPREPIAAHKRSVKFVAFTPDGKSLISGGIDEVQDPGRPKGTMADLSIVKLWDLATRKSTTLGQNASSITPGPQADKLNLNKGLSAIAPYTTVTGDAKHLVFYQPRFASATILYDLASHKVNSEMLLSPDGKAQVAGDTLRYFATPYDGKAVTRTVPLTGASKITAGFDQHSTFSPDSKTLVMRDKDENLMLFDVPSGKNTATLRGVNGRWYAFSPDGKLLVAPMVKKSAASPDVAVAVKLVDVASGRDLSLQPIPTNLIGPPTFSPDSKVLVFGYPLLEVYSAANGKRVRTLQNPGKAAGPDVVFSPDGKTVAAPVRDGSLRLWNLATGKITASVRGGASPPAFSPDGKMLAMGSEDGKIMLWDVGRTAAK